MTWILFILVWSAGGALFGATTGHDFMRSRSYHDINFLQAVALFFASGPFVWLLMLLKAMGWFK